MNNRNSPLGTLRIREYRSFIIARFFYIMALRTVTTVVGWRIYEITHNPLAIGLIGLSPRQRPLPGLHHRSLSKFFGTVSVDLVARKRPKRESLVNALAQWIGSRMSPGRPERKGRGRPP